MPQFTPIVLADGEPTPINHTFDFKSVGGGRLVAVNRAAPTLETQEVLALEIKAGGSSKAASKGRLTLGDPKVVTDASTGVVSVGAMNSFVGEFTYAPGSSEQERENLRVMVANAILHPVVSAALDKVEPVYG